MASFREEVQKDSSLLALEAPQLVDLLSQASEIDGGQRTPPMDSPSGHPRLKSADISWWVSKTGEQAIIEGSLLVFYCGKWTDDGNLTVLGRLRDQCPASQTRFKERIEASLGLLHKNVLGFYGHITIKDIVYSVSPWIENGNVREYIGWNSDVDRLRLLGEVASGMEFLHERGVVHGDLCGKNILINGEGKAIVCGFDLSDCSNPTLDLSRARWFAPEKIMSTGVTFPTEKGDIWSFGLLCLEIFTGEDPYSPTSDLYVPVLLSQGVTPEHPGSKAVDLSPNMWKLMESCWKIVPSERPSMALLQSRIREMRLRRSSSSQSSGNSDPHTHTPISPTRSSILSAEANFETAPTSYVPLLRRTSVRSPPLGTQELNLLAVPRTPPIEIVDQQTRTQVQTGHPKRVNSPPSSASGRLPPLFEEPLDFNTGTPSSPPSQFPLVRGRWRQPRPSVAPSPSTASAPSPSLSLDSRHESSVVSSSEYSTTSTDTSGPRWWSIRNHIKSRTTFDSAPDINGSSLPPCTPNGDILSVPQRALHVEPSTPSRTQAIPTRVPKAVDSQVSRPVSLLVPLPQSRRWEPVSPVVLEFLESVENDSKALLRNAEDGSVSAGNLEGLVSRVITDTADPTKDSNLRATFLTVYQLFTTSERLFEILKRRFGSMELDPLADHIRSRYNILLFIERWFKKGFGDEVLECSARIKEFAVAIRGSGTMEAKAQEIANLIDNPDYVRLRQPGSCDRLRREPAERPKGLTPADLAAALTVVEGERFKYITHWDYVNFIHGRSSARRRIEVFNIVHDLVAMWAKRSILQSDDLDERMKTYEEWIHVAKACRDMNNFSSAAAIVFTLSSSAITGLALTCESKATSILHALARELVPTDGVYENTLMKATTRSNDFRVIPWLDPLLSSLNSTFARSNLIVEVDGHPLIDFNLCTKLSEQINSLVQYSPLHALGPTRSEVLAYVEYNLKSSMGDDVWRDTEARSIKLLGEERSLLDRRQRLRLLGMAWTPPQPARK